MGPGVGEVVSHLEPLRVDPLHDPTIGERVAQLHLGHTPRTVVAGRLLGEAKEMDDTMGSDDVGEAGDVGKSVGVAKRMEKP